jgi:uncharacterized membrane protein YhaH (DUF805 family)
MFSSNLSRGPFVLYTILFAVLEASFVLSYITLVMGFPAFAESKPGHSREGIALAVLIIGILFSVARANIAIRRNRDRNGKTSFIWGYNILLFLVSMFTASEFLFRTFGSDSDGNSGLYILGLVSFSLWVRLVISGSESTSGVEGEIAAMAKKYGGIETPSQPQNFSQPSAPSFNSKAGPVTFGKRR